MLRTLKTTSKYSVVYRFLWKRGTDAEERAEQLEWLCRELLLREWGQQELGRRNEEEKRYKADEIGRSAEALRRRIRSREVEEENEAKLAECLVRNRSSTGFPKYWPKIEMRNKQLQFEHEKISRRIARRREEQEELKYEQRRLSQKNRNDGRFSRAITVLRRATTGGSTQRGGTQTQQGDIS